MQETAQGICSVLRHCQLGMHKGGEPKELAGRSHSTALSAAQCSPGRQNSFLLFSAETRRTEGLGIMAQLCNVERPCNYRPGSLRRTQSHEESERRERSWPLDFCECLPLAGSSQKPATLGACWFSSQHAAWESRGGLMDSSLVAGVPLCSVSSEPSSSSAVLGPGGRRQRSSLLGFCILFSFC